MKKPVKILMAALILSAALICPGKTWAAQAQTGQETAAAETETETQKETAYPDGLQKADGKLYFYRKGKALTNTLKSVSGKLYYFTWDGSALTDAWKTVGKGRYYFGSNGAAYAGKSRKIGDHYYVFRENGKLYTGSGNRLVRLGKKRYYVNKNGRAIPGWHMIGTKVFYASRAGRLATNKKVGYIKLNSKGYASNKYQGMAKIYAARFIKKHSKESDSRKTKLRKCFKYILKNRHYIAHYVTDKKASTTNGWQYKAACDLLCDRRMEGNCRNFASSIAAIAKELGYKPIIYSLSWHSVVRIGDRWYDNMYGGRFSARRLSHYYSYKKKFTF